MLTGCGAWLAALFLVCLGTGSVRLAAAPQWRVLETPRFTVVSQISEKETRSWAAKFNQFIEAMGTVIRIEDKHLPKLTIVMFAKSKDFGAYRPIGENGKVQDWVAGYFSRQESWSVIGMAENLEDENMRRLIYHEGVHWLASADQFAYPKWFDEGIAELFSTFDVEKGKAVFGRPISEHVALLRSETPLPIERLILVSSTDPLFNESDRTGIFYAQSWAFVHYLMFGQRPGQKGTIHDFLTHFYGNNSVEDAFRKAFGMDYKDMDKALRQYLRAGKYFISSKPLPDGTRISGTFQPATPAVVQVALARLAFGSGRLDKARQHADEAVRLNPSYSPGYVMQAWALQREDDVIRFLEVAQKAVQLGASDPEALDLLAQAKYRKAHSLGGVPPRDAREIADLLEQAIDALPSLKYAYCNLTQILSSVEKVENKDVKYVAQGIRLFPDERTIVIGWIYVLKNQNNYAEAAKLLDRVLSQPEKLSPDQLKQLQFSKSSWDVDETLRQVAALMDERKFREAVALLDALSGRNPVVEARSIIAQQRGLAVACATVQDADKAKSEGRADEAVLLYERALKMKSLTGFLREHIARQMRVLKGADTSEL